jgi:hypothetical protein
MISHRMLGNLKKTLKSRMKSNSISSRTPMDSQEKQMKPCRSNLNPAIFFLSDKYSLIKFNTHTHAHLTQPHMSLGKITIKKKYVLKKLYRNGSAPVESQPILNKSQKNKN